MRLLGTAIRNRWLTESQKPDAMKAIQAGLNSADERVRQTAVKNLIAMEAQNQKDQHAEIKDFAERVLAIAIELGIDVGAIGDASTFAIEAGGVDGEVAGEQQE